ncbi:putative two-component response regulator SKN7p [Thelonectria olida]|uniref:Two-component response regulator SKN7p n=1 Tax=Thelonectria olida TaxID=1576542 RepID=A0A9P9AIM2_9HYPO|nr:putative two-component response regulator SKN7p [Thelonectria olida]
MLENPAHQDAARWGKDGATFVVVENEEREVHPVNPPKHFEHNNMASFVRQLNKYDFHKVRQTNDGGSSSNGANILEFKHPNFRATEDFTTPHHISVLTEQLTAAQQQVQQLRELFTEISQSNRLLVKEVFSLQKTLNSQKQSQHEMLNFLSSDRNRHQQQMQHLTPTSLDGEEIAPELRRAREHLSNVIFDSLAYRELECLQGVYGPPANSALVMQQAQIQMIHDPTTDINRYPVYAVCQTVDIDPFNSGHINKIPYAIPNDATKKPKIFLLEGDPTGSKMGMKFLKSMRCEVEHAISGFLCRLLIYRRG